jgi:hypothetical protein
MSTHTVVTAEDRGRLNVFTEAQESDYRFLIDQVSEMMGGLDFLITKAVDNLSEVNVDLALHIANDLKDAREALLRSRRKARQVINGEYEKLVEGVRS